MFEKICPICGVKFESRRVNAITCGHECAKEWRSRQYRKKKPQAAERRTPAPVYHRGCHDCGKKTNDYRCPACLARWRKKYGVRLDADE